MQIENRKEENFGRFVLEDKGKLLAELVYSSPSPDKMIIEHTEVNPEMRGKKLGDDLILAAVNYARIHTLKIDPQCSFARSVFKRKKEYQDVLA